MAVFLLLDIAVHVQLITDSLTHDYSYDKITYIARVGRPFMNINKFPINSIINYLRRSRRDLEREKRTGEDTLSEQKKLMDKVLNDLGIPYDQKTEIVSGDKISMRPVFKSILKDLKNKKYDAVAVKEISRLGRGSMSDMGEIYDLIIGEVTGKHIYIITPNRIYDPTNSSDLRQIRFEMFFAREEFEMTRERLVGARYNAAMEGKWMGQVPYGYKRNRKTMRLEPDGEHAEIVRFIFDSYVNGINGRKVGSRAIATYLTKKGIKTPRGGDQWYSSVIRRMLKNKAYIGSAKFRTTRRTAGGDVIDRPKSEHIIVKDAHEPLVDKEMFEKVQNITKNRYIPSTRLDTSRYELSGVLTCGKCGDKAVINRYRRKQKNGYKYETYLRCTGCFSIKYETIKENVLNILNHLTDVESELLYNLYLKAQDDYKKESNVDNKEKMQKVFERSTEERKKELEKRLKFIQDRHFKGVYDDDDYLMFKKEIEDEINSLDKIEKNVDKQEVDDSEDQIISIESAIEKFKDYKDIYGSLDCSEDKNELLLSIFDYIGIVVTKSGTKSRVAQVELDVRLKHQFWLREDSGRVEA